jgi:hypothetical protein
VLCEGASRKEEPQTVKTEPIGPLTFIAISFPTSIAQVGFSPLGNSRRWDRSSPTTLKKFNDMLRHDDDPATVFLSGRRCAGNSTKLTKAKSTILIPIEEMSTAAQKSQGSLLTR